MEEQSMPSGLARENAHSGAGACPIKLGDRIIADSVADIGPGAWQPGSICKCGALYQGELNVMKYAQYLLGETNRNKESIISQYAHNLG